MKFRLSKHRHRERKPADTRDTTRTSAQEFAYQVEQLVLAFGEQHGETKQDAEVTTTGGDK